MPLESQDVVVHIYRARALEPGPQLSDEPGDMLDQGLTTHDESSRIGVDAIVGPRLLEQRTSLGFVRLGPCVCVRGYGIGRADLGFREDGCGRDGRKQDRESENSP